MAKDKKVLLLKEAVLEYLADHELIEGEYLQDLTSHMAQNGFGDINEDQLGQALTELAQERKIVIVVVAEALQIELAARYAGF